MADIIDINVLETVEEVTINVVDNVIQVNINKVTNAPITNTSDLINDGEDGVHPYITLLDLPSNLILYPTTVASDVSGYVKLVTDIHDPEYNSTAVNVSTGSITTTNQLISSLITVPNLISGNPGVFNISTVGNIRRTAGSGTAEFYFNVYKRDSLGVETLIGVSNPTLPVNNGVYAEFNSTAIWDDGIFVDTDRVVLKFYASRIAGGSNPTYEFQFGGLTPVRTLVPIPLSVVPNNGLQSVTGTTVDNTDPLNPIVNVPTLQQVLDYNHNLVDGNNFQGSASGFGNTGVNVNSFGTGATVYATGSNTNAFGSGAAASNSEEHVNAFGEFAGEINSYKNVNLFGYRATADAENQNVFSKWVSGVTKYLGRLSFNNITADRKWELPDASGTVALTSDIPAPITIDATPTDGSTNAVSSNGVFDALALKTGRLISDATVSTPHTGTATNTIVKSYLIPANTFASSDCFNLVWKMYKVGVSGTLNIRAYVNTSVAIPANPIALNFLTATLIYSGVNRSFRINGGNLYFPNTGNITSGTDEGTSSVATEQSVSFNVTVDNYLILAVQSNPADSVTINQVLVRQ